MNGSDVEPRILTQEDSDETARREHSSQHSVPMQTDQEIWTD